MGLRRHDVVIVNDTNIHFLLDRPIAGRYQELHSGIADVATAQVEIIAALDRHRVGLIVLDSFFDDRYLDGAKDGFQRNVPEIGATDLDRFIRASYRPVRRIGRYTIWHRSPVGLP